MKSARQLFMLRVAVDAMHFDVRRSYGNYNVTAGYDGRAVRSEVRWWSCRDLIF